VAAAPALDERGEDPGDEEHRPTAEVGDQVERRHRLAPRLPDRVQGSGERGVVDVVTHARGERAVLAPAGHARVDQAGVATGAVGRADAEPLGHARPEPLDQHVGALGQAQHDLGAHG
jgi:hypothetical protein